MKKAYAAPQAEEFVPVSEIVLLDQSLEESGDNENNLGDILGNIGIASF